MSFYKDNKGYLDKYWDDELNNTPKESLQGNEDGVLYFKCKKCGKSWSISSLSLLYSYGECNCEDRNLLKKYWDTEKNNEIGLSVEDIPLRSGKRIFLKCPVCGGEWNDYDVADVTYRKKSCPYCSGRRVLSGVNDLLSCYPEVVEKYWDWEKNSVEPNTLYKNTSKKAFWLCPECGYSWESPVSRLTRDGQGCPCCAGKKVKEGYNDFLSQHPDIVAKYWDYDRNKIKPSEVTSGSNKKIYCKCPLCGGEWEDAPKILKDRKVCPLCWGRKEIKLDNEWKCDEEWEGLPELHYSPSYAKLLNEGISTEKNFISLREYRPDLVDKVWNYEENEKRGITPDNISYGSHKKVFLTCKDCGNSWDDWDVHTLSNTKVGCPYCTNQRLGKDSISFLKGYPELVDKYWDWEKNSEEGIYPDEIFPKSNKQVHLHCKKCGYSWNDYSPASLVYHKLGCPVCAGQRVLKGYNDFQSRYPDLVDKFWDFEANDVKPDEISWGSGKWINFKCKECGHKWIVQLHDLSVYGRGCPQCARNNMATRSKQEDEITNFLKENYDGIIETSKVGLLPNNMELDIYIPKKKIGIEFNGIYWHSEIYKKKDRHYRKHKYCEESGIKLFQIWEDQWRDKKEIVKRLLLSKVGVLDQVKVNARECSIKEVSKNEAESFMNENHIQGFTVASVYLALVSENWGIVAICQFLKTGKEGIYNLNRYATSCNVRGGFTKLIKNFERKYHPKKIITFSDNDYSDGGLYRNNGFILEEELKPDYYYTNNNFNKRYHKFNYRKERFYNDPHLTYMPDLTERELADLNKIFRVWDSGKIRWVKVFN